MSPDTKEIDEHRRSPLLISTEYLIINILLEYDSVCITDISRLIKWHIPVRKVVGPYAEFIYHITDVCFGFGFIEPRGGVYARNIITRFAYPLSIGLIL